MALLYEALTDRVIDAAIQVHRELGPGFLESVYEKALRVALQSRGIPYFSQVEMEILFQGESVGFHRIDLVIDSKLIVELKAVKAFEEIHFAQVRSYLKATRLQLGLLLNFNAPSLTIKRVILTHGDSARSSGDDRP